MTDLDRAPGGGLACSPPHAVERTCRPRTPARSDAGIEGDHGRRASSRHIERAGGRLAARATDALPRARRRCRLRRGRVPRAGAAAALRPRSGRPLAAGHTHALAGRDRAGVGSDGRGRARSSMAPTSPSCRPAAPAHGGGSSLIRIWATLPASAATFPSCGFHRADGAVPRTAPPRRPTGRCVRPGPGPRLGPGRGTGRDGHRGMDHASNGVPTALVSAATARRLLPDAPATEEITLVLPEARTPFSPYVLGVLRGRRPTAARMSTSSSAPISIISASASPDERGDSIYNGADDNAFGVAARPRGRARIATDASGAASLRDLPVA